MNEINVDVVERLAALLQRLDEAHRRLSESGNGASNRATA